MTPRYSNSIPRMTIDSLRPCAFVRFISLLFFSLHRFLTNLMCSWSHSTRMQTKTYEWLPQLSSSVLASWIAPPCASIHCDSVKIEAVDTTIAGRSAARMVGVDRAHKWRRRLIVREAKEAQASRGGRRARGTHTRGSQTKGAHEKDEEVVGRRRVGKAHVR